MVPVSFLYDDMFWNNIECRVFFVHDCTFALNKCVPVFKESNKRIQSIVTRLDLRDYNQSQLLQKIKNLGTYNFLEKVLKSLWLDKMPYFIINILLVSKES